MTIPDVVVFLENNRVIIRNLFDISFCVKNVGQQTVRSIKFEGDLSFKPKNIALEDIPWVINGIDFLPPNEILSRSIFESTVAHEQLNFYDNKPPKTVIKVKYRDIFKREHNAEFTLNLRKIDVLKK